MFPLAGLKQPLYRHPSDDFHIPTFENDGRVIVQPRQ